MYYSIKYTPPALNEAKKYSTCKMHLYSDKGSLRQISEPYSVVVLQACVVIYVNCFLLLPVAIFVTFITSLSNYIPNQPPGQGKSAPEAPPSSGPSSHWNLFSSTDHAEFPNLLKNKGRASSPIRYPVINEQTSAGKPAQPARWLLGKLPQLHVSTERLKAKQSSTSNRRSPLQ